mmetsp:Transcript_1879/g.2861  ORF Transcript_1879/g.2861 Transcript_1879/m.2861 type:complete len:588 (+) Transcript_1879:42-1805(+)
MNVAADERALIELERQLRSQKLSEQCEAIVLFGRLVNQQPVPVIVNTALLKLADVFRNSNNLVRLCILTVIQQSEPHFSKVLNVGQLLKRLTVVLQSNDPVARALTLRTLGAMASLLSKRTDVHHKMLTCLLNTRHINYLIPEAEVEIYAAMFAIERVCALSPSFAHAIIDTLESFLRDDEVPAFIKLRLIPIFRHMHGDLQSANKAHEVLVRVLQMYPAREFVITVLRALTALTTASCILLPMQIEVLVKQVEVDPRRTVKAEALRGLNSLGRIGTSAWRLIPVPRVCQVLCTTRERVVKEHALRVLRTITSRTVPRDSNLSPSPSGAESDRSSKGVACALWDENAALVWRVCVSILCDPSLSSDRSQPGVPAAQTKVSEDIRRLVECKGSEGSRLPRQNDRCLLGLAGQVLVNLVCAYGAAVSADMHCRNVPHPDLPCEGACCLAFPLVHIICDCIGRILSAAPQEPGPSFSSQSDPMNIDDFAASAPSHPNHADAKRTPSSPTPTLKPLLHCLVRLSQATVPLRSSISRLLASRLQPFITPALLRNTTTTTASAANDTDNANSATVFGKGSDAVCSEEEEEEVE